jgi:RimJ/RimL family protein N-acetyltransferase
MKTQNGSVSSQSAALLFEGEPSERSTLPKKMLHVPTLSGKHVRLRPVQEQDAQILYTWASDPLEMYLWRGRRELLSFHAFCEELQTNIQNDLVHLIVEGLQSQRAIGWVYAYHYSVWEQRCFSAIYVTAGGRHFGAAAEAGMLFLDYLFSYFPIRKIAADVYAFNAASLQVIKNAGFQVEGVLRQEHYFGGTFHDIIRLGLLESEWLLLREQYRVDHLSQM